MRSDRSRAASLARSALCGLLLACICASGAAAQQPQASIEAIPDQVWRNMQGKSWHAGLACAPRADLALLTIPYRDFQGEVRSGRLIVARSAARDVAAAFQEIFESGRFRIAKMRLIDDYGGSDDASMDDNNTSAFNCRRVEGGQGMSKHARGMAVDINPVQNPYIDATGMAPRAGRAYDQPHERRAGITGLITKGDVVTRAFARIGWSWGGNFRNTKDYQHFAR
ncbi:MAG: M15 family metallopeptidase [Beijerinckiaceae bacterium]|nr:M15 family metallopeptidase [Beijerinckiaceae bacterium]